MADQEMKLLRAWFLAARPKTLPASLTPVMVGTVLAWSMGSARVFVAVLCGLFAVLGQVAANLANDFGDGVRGVDGDGRLGPARAVASGWISPEAMRRGVIFAVVLMCAAGAGLVALCGWWVMAVVAGCAAGALLYTAGPWPLAYHGWGDAMVLFFRLGGGRVHLFCADRNLDARRLAGRKRGRPGNRYDPDGQQLSRSGGGPAGRKKHADRTAGRAFWTVVVSGEWSVVCGCLPVVVGVRRTLVGVAAATLPDSASDDVASDRAHPFRTRAQSAVG